MSPEPIPQSAGVSALFRHACKAATRSVAGRIDHGVAVAERLGYCRRHKEPGEEHMIKKFHVLYVGQIELDNVGLNGTPANERRSSARRLAEAFFTARDVAQLMDELGF